MRSVVLMLLALLAWSVGGSSAGAPVEPVTHRVPVPMDHYYSLEEVHATMRALQEAYPEFVHIEEIGKSRGGHPLLVATLHDPLGGPSDSRPAMYVDGNMHGNEIQGAEVCLHLMDRLLAGRERDSFLADLLRQVTFYIHPVVNPDSRVHFFESPSTPHSPRWNRRPWDQDSDGLIDEDGPDDVDGDGRILGMRVADPAGQWVTDGNDPRVMRRRRPDEPGQWRRYWNEGTDEDGDGEINEDGIGGVDLNRNFPTAWEPPHVQFAAGPYPLSEPEARAIADFLESHPNVAAIQSFHNAGDMILRPPSYRDDGAMPNSDKAVYDRLAARGATFLPGYRYLQTFEGLYPVHGGFLDWGYEGLGIFFFTNELWKIPDPSDADAWVPGNGAALHWLDVATRSREWVDWHEVEHPQLGRVEIGGLDQWATRVPPPEFLADMATRNALFCIEHASQMPQLIIEPPDVEHMAGGIVRIRVRVRNDRLIPTLSGMARVQGITPPDTVSLELPPGAVVLGSGTVQSTVRDMSLDSRVRPWVVVPYIPGLGAVDAEFLVWARQGTQARIRVRSQRGGRTEHFFDL